MARKAMVIGPIRGYINPKTHEFEPEKREFLEGVIQELENRRYKVYSAHRREGWGESTWTPEECTPLDNAWIKDSDLVVAALGKPSARSTHIEMGWTTACGKDLILLLEKDYDYCTFIDGLKPTFEKVQYVWHNSYEEGLDGLRTCLGNIEQREQRTRTFWRTATSLAAAASLVLAFGIGHLTKDYRDEQSFQQSRIARLRDYAIGLAGLTKDGKYVGEHGTVERGLNSVVMYPSGSDISKLRLYGTNIELAQKSVLRKLAQ